MNSQQIAAISARLLEKFAETGSMREAYDSVMGAGEYDKLAGSLYDELRAKGQK